MTLERIIGSGNGEWGQSGVELYLISLDLGCPDRDREQVGSVDAEMELLHVTRMDDEVRANIRLQVRAIMEPAVEGAGRRSDAGAGCRGACNGKGERSGDCPESLSLIEQEIPPGPKMFRQEQILVVQMPGPEDEHKGDDGDTYRLQEASALSILYIHPYWSEERLKVDLLLSVGLVTEEVPGSRNIRWMEQTVRIEGEGLPEEARVVAIAWRADHGDREATTELRTQLAYLSDEGDPMGILEKVTTFSDGILWLGEPRLTLNGSNWAIYGPAWLPLSQSLGAEAELAFGEVPAEEEGLQSGFGAIEPIPLGRSADLEPDAQAKEEIAATSDTESAIHGVAREGGVTVGNMAIGYGAVANGTVNDGTVHDDVVGEGDTDDVFAAGVVSDGMSLAQDEVDSALQEATVTLDQSEPFGPLSGIQALWPHDMEEMLGGAPIPELSPIPLQRFGDIGYDPAEHEREFQADPGHREWTEYPAPPGFDGVSEYPLPEADSPQDFHDQTAAAQDEGLAITMERETEGLGQGDSTELIGGFADYLDSTLYTAQYGEGFLYPDPSLATAMSEGTEEESEPASLWEETPAGSFDEVEAAPDIVAEAQTASIVAEADLPSIVAEADLPSIVSEADLPSIVAEADLPSIVAEADLPSIVSEADLPSIVAEADLPSIVADADLPSIVAEADLVSIVAEADLPSIAAEADLTPVEAEAEMLSVTEEAGTAVTEEMEATDSTAEAEAPLVPAEPVTPVLVEKVDPLFEAEEVETEFLESEVDTSTMGMEIAEYSSPTPLAGDLMDILPELAQDTPAEPPITQPLSIKTSLSGTPRITSRFRDRLGAGDGAPGKKIGPKEEPQPIPAVRRLARPLPNIPVAVNPAPEMSLRESKPRDIRRIQRPGDDLHKTAAAAKNPMTEKSDAKGNRKDGGWRFVVVGAGDTVSSIARRNRIPEEVVRSVNKLSTDDTLRAGQTLMLPRHWM
ncbi:lysm domain protein [Heliomicrobium modesticaldum Ice1]|uniref:Lysm domain protein n=1 Tax=Heliobacterium modesticaldum (strain ATCC 51547 / Ice1) TaxID=498761 RepID=B0TEX6_HELMI|nr:LysM domain-containing protein [Heliomicrobium modesticaldum]ABZ82959.1 lysm domain protein [Heliomicrobium modesticaldum Ice1]